MKREDAHTLGDLVLREATSTTNLGQAVPSTLGTVEQAVHASTATLP